LQIDETIWAALRSSLSTEGFPVPSAGPPLKAVPPPESAVPEALVPGAAKLVQNMQTSGRHSDDCALALIWRS